MSLGDDVERALPAMRSEAESLMRSVCVIRRAGVGEPVMSELTGEYVDPAPTLVYAGKCRVKFVSTVVSDVDAASQMLSQYEGLLSLPIGAAGAANVLEDDAFEITGNVKDPALVGMTGRITRFHAQTDATARRFPFEVTRG